MAPRQTLGTMREMSETAEFPSFSVVVPTYQRKDLVCDVVRSLSKVDYPGALEVIIVVDGSTDGTTEALRHLELPFAFRIVEQPNGGAANARNRGAAEAKNEIVLFLDDDMICEPQLVEEHAKMYRLGADAVIGDTPLCPGSPRGFLSNSVGRWIDSEHVNSPLSPFDIFSGQLSVRRTVFHEAGGFDESFTVGDAFSNEDADLGLRLLSNYNVMHNPEAVSRLRYVVSPREYMARAASAVEGDLLFVSKHPQFSHEIFEARGQSSKLAKYLYLPLSRIKLVSRLLSSTAVFLAQLGLKTPFHSNRLLARFFSGARSVAYWSALRSRRAMPGAGKVLILCYHSIQDQSSDPVLAPYGVAPTQFTEQLRSLARRGYCFIGPKELEAFLRYDAPLPRRAALLTFDDCYADLLEVAQSVLKPRGIQAIAFSVTGMSSATNEWDQRLGSKRERLLNARELRALCELGFEIGSHSRTHRELPLLDDVEQRQETLGSKEDLAAQGLGSARYFAYPFGAVDPSSRRAVQDAGYIAAFGTKQELATKTSDPFDLPRVTVLAQDRGWRFLLKTSNPAGYAQMQRMLSLPGRLIARLRRLSNGRG